MRARIRDRAFISGVARASCLALMLVLTMEMSVSEFGELRNLSAEGRRDRLHLPDGCTPAITAMRPANRRSQELIVLVDCQSADPGPHDPEPAGYIR